MLIVDTSVWIHLLGGVSNPESGWLVRNIKDSRLALTDLILCETLQGIRHDEIFHQTQRELAKFQILNSGGDTIALASARNYRTLRKQGITVRKTVDCLIATFCIEGGHSLLHRDRDFDVFEKHLGLKVIHPAPTQ